MATRVFGGISKSSVVIDQISATVQDSNFSTKGESNTCSDNPVVSRRLAKNFTVTAMRRPLKILTISVKLFVSNFFYKKSVSKQRFEQVLLDYGIYFSDLERACHADYQFILVVKTRIYNAKAESFQ